MEALRKITNLLSLLALVALFIPSVVGEASYYYLTPLKGLSWSNKKSVDFGDTNSSKYFTGGNVFNSEITYNNPFSICAWVYPKSNVGNNCILMSKMDNSGTGWDFEYASGNRFQFYSSPNSASTRIQVRTANTYAASNWYFVCLTHSGNSSATGMTFYVNGTADTSIVINTSAANWTTSAPFNIASHNNGSTAQGAFYRGKADEITFWNAALSGAEVTSLYNSGTPVDPSSKSFWASKNISYYRMGDLTDSASTLVDRGKVGGINLTGTNVVSGDIVSIVPP